MKLLTKWRNFEYEKADFDAEKRTPCPGYLDGPGIDALFTDSSGMAADDPLSIVNNLSDFIFSIIRALGIIILGWGVVQVGMSIQSHDASQRTQGFLCLFGGLLIAFAKEILTTIGVA